MIRKGDESVESIGCCIVDFLELHLHVIFSVGFSFSLPGLRYIFCRHDLDLFNHD